MPDSGQSQSNWSAAYNTLRPALQPSARTLLWSVAFGLAARWVFLPLPFLLRRILREDLKGFSGGTLGAFDSQWREWPELSLVALGMFAMLCLGLVWAQKITSEKAAQMTIALLRRQMLDHLMHLKLNYFDRRAAGKVVLRFTGDANSIKSFITGTLVNICVDVPTILVIFLLLFIMKWQVALAVCAVIPVAVTVFRRLNPELRRRTRFAGGRQSILCGHLTQRLTMIEEIKVNRSEQTEARAGHALADEIAQAHFNRRRISAVLVGVSAGLPIAALGLAVWVGGHLVLAGSMSLPDLLGFLLLCSFLRGPIRRCASANLGFQRAHVALERIHAFLSREVEPNLTNLSPGFLVLGQRIEFSKLGFRYRRKEPWVFKGLDLTIDGPGLVVLEGPTGVGKSTLFSLILRLRRPQRGAVRVDGISLRNVNVESVRRQIGWLPQEVNLFAGIVADNVRYGCPELADAQVEDLLRRTIPRKTTDFGRFNGKTRVIELGRNLSPLQRVQVGLARALATDPRILLLDNPTAHMGEAEKAMLLRIIDELRQERLIVVVTSEQWLKDEANRRINLAEIHGAVRAESVRLEAGHQDRVVATGEL